MQKHNQNLKTSKSSNTKTAKIQCGDLHVLENCKITIQRPASLLIQKLQNTMRGPACPGKLHVICKQTLVKGFITR